MTTFDFDELTVSDLHKDVYGYRPSSDWWCSWKIMTPEQKQAEWDRLVLELEETIAQEEKAKEQAHERWTAHMAKMMADNGVDYKTALRWDIQAMDCGGNYGFYCYLWGIDYSNELDIRKVLKN